MNKANRIFVVHDQSNPPSPQGVEEQGGLIRRGKVSHSTTYMNVCRSFGGDTHRFSC